jgi:hypothetical protein
MGVHDIIEISKPELVDANIVRSDFRIGSAQYLLGGGQLFSLHFDASLGQCLHYFRAGDIPVREEDPPTKPPQAASLTHFAQVLTSVDWNGAESATAKATIEDGLVPIGWVLKRFSLNRYRTSRGMGLSVSGIVSTAGQCFRVTDVVVTLGTPWSITMAPPLGFLDISTPEEVERYLDSRLKIASVAYRLNGIRSYSLQFSSRTGCLSSFLL